MSGQNQQLETLIASTFFKKEGISASQLSIYPILGKGFVNEVWSAEVDGKKIIIRINNEDSRAEAIYVKEQWCMEQAVAAGIPGPKVLELGSCDGVPYMIQTFEEGKNGLEATIDPLELWRIIGEYAAIYHRIPVKGYGENLVDSEQGEFRSPPHSGSDGSWNDHARYNIESLNDEDKLLELGVMTREQSRQVRRLFEQLVETEWNFGLNHGDLSLKNILVDESTSDDTLSVTLIDWGSAEVGPVPHIDLMQLLLMEIVEGKPGESEVDAFLEGYGLSSGVPKETRALFVLRSFDKLRWAIDCSPGDVESFTEIARRALTQLDD